MNKNIGKWIKRYVIITICYLLVLAPVFTVAISYNIFSSDQGRTIFIIVLGIVTIAVYGVMTYFMLKGKDKLK